MVMKRMVMKRRVALVLFIVLLSWCYQATRPPPPRICGSQGGPPITAPRIKLRDGRHLAYVEHGVPRQVAKYKIISVHGFSSSKLDAVFPTSFSQELAEELRIYIVGFDRPGYGESDPHPNRTPESLAMDIQELGDQLGLGSKFYVLGYSMGGQAIWSCLHYIPNRLAGAGLIAPVVNYWWPSFPADLSTEAYNKQPLGDQWAIRVVHYIPWLTYWWNTQKLFPASSVVSRRFNKMFSRQDFEILMSSSLAASPERHKIQEQVIQQGTSESLFRDMKIGFGKWEFDPMGIENPFPNNEGSVHLWQGDEDRLVPVELQRYIVNKLPWINYHELPGAGHVFPMAKEVFESMIREFLVGKK